MANNDFSNLGFDYGIKPYFGLVGDGEFSDLFKKADCGGILYYFGKEATGEMTPVKIEFIFRNADPAEKCFNLLLGWIEKSNNDGDAVGIDFIEKSKGGYTIAISPEINRFYERVTPSHLKKRVSPIFMVTTHFKEIEALGNNYLNFKANYKKSERIAVGYAIGTPTKIEKQSEKHFKKTEFNFYNENEIPKNSPIISYKATQDISSFDPKRFPRFPPDTIEEISLRRISEMKSLLPLTCNRLHNLWLGETQKRLSAMFDPQLIKQAVCNLTIFQRLQKIKELSPDFTKSGYSTRILEYLLSTYESFDSYYPNDDYYSDERIIKQIQNDEVVLKTYLSK